GLGVLIPVGMYGSFPTLTSASPPIPVITASEQPSRIVASAPTLPVKSAPSPSPSTEQVLPASPTDNSFRSRVEQLVRQLTGEKWVIDLGAFDSKVKAEIFGDMYLTKKLKEAFPSAYLSIRPIQQESVTKYVGLIGPFTKKGAEDACSLIY